MSLLAVDPGLRACGVAVFERGALARAALVRVASEPPDDDRAAAVAAMARDVLRWSGAVGALVVEWPRVYASQIRAGGAARGDPNDLLPLAGVGAALAALTCAPAASFAPSEWKGQMTKEACARRALSRLSPAELAVAEAACAEARSRAHNVLDAIGLGLHALGRLAPRRAIS